MKPFPHREHEEDFEGIDARIEAMRVDVPAGFDALEGADAEPPTLWERDPRKLALAVSMGLIGEDDAIVLIDLDALDEHELILFERIRAKEPPSRHDDPEIVARERFGDGWRLVHLAFLRRFYPEGS